MSLSHAGIGPLQAITTLEQRVIRMQVGEVGMFGRVIIQIVGWLSGDTPAGIRVTVNRIDMTYLRHVPVYSMRVMVAFHHPLGGGPRIGMSALGVLATVCLGGQLFHVVTVCTLATSTAAASRV